MLDKTTKPAINLVYQDGNKKKQAGILIEIADSFCAYFHNDIGDCFAKIKVKNHTEVWAIKSSGFKDWLGYKFYKLTNTGISSNAFKDALDTLNAKAKFDGVSQEVYLRVAQTKGKIYIDLCNDDWQVIEIDNHNWRILNTSPVAFIRNTGMKALPMPKAGGNIELLKQHLNINERDFPLIVGWLLMSLQADSGAYPILILQSEEGSAKTTTTRLLRRLIDPNTNLISARPKNEDDLMLIASCNHALAIDNLSGININVSDTLCGISTGTASSKRKLFSDMDIISIKAKRPIILNGIDDIATRGDLASRSLVINLPRLTSQKDERQVKQAFNQDYPYIFGALLSKLSIALNTIDTVKIDNPPRMLDFAKWASSSESVQGEFMDSYQHNINQATYNAIEASTFANTIYTLINKVSKWSGTATELLTVLDNKVNDRIRMSRNWVDSPEKVSKQLKRFQSLFRKVGIVISKAKLDGKRVITIERI
ncbi:hypothetical protein [Bathymodiolus septemdierum thioautotrophic gill symbiont]|uniref:ATP-binding protein n=1 Tax=endosymbiont of Bathymodiolus septemdierum str. Myojin knoll TaxID=1303921 RepID=A0A0P0URM5_9GAMM|nr:hypothetical protein [Bathymodiolus septemdierum thioautotrophic gill symbiont]BAS67779.1 conserved hypothetical protein [endosymbiont of Bathymodiolus septemdierum str. Myojin knoll]